KSNRGTDAGQRAVSETETRYSAAVAQLAKRTAATEWQNMHIRLQLSIRELDKKAWDAASRRDWKAYEKLQRPGYNWGYFGTGRNAPRISDLQRRRYFDPNIREVEFGQITDDVTFLK